MQESKILEIAKALSDELRIRIVGVLSSGRPMRYTEVMKALGMDAAVDSSKFAYHMGVLTDAGIAEKVDDSYRVTQGGKEIFKAMVKVAEGWPDYQYQDSLKRMKGDDMNRLLWSRMLLAVTPWCLLAPFIWWKAEGLKTAPMMLVVGLLFLLLGLYWLKRLRYFWDPKWEKFFNACETVLGKNGIMVGFINVLNQSALVILLLTIYFVEKGRLSLDPLTFAIIVGCLGGLITTIGLSRKLSILWDGVSTGVQVPDFSESMKLGYKFVMGVFIIVGALFMAHGVTEAVSGSVGAGIGLIGGTFGGWRDYRKYTNMGN